MMPPDSRVMVLPDGRDLAWLELGPADGSPVMAFHGTPGSRLQFAIDSGPAEAAGVRLIVPDRPGYGLSTYQRGRRLVDWATDVECLADHLGVSTFAVIGMSGGGPHALVCARMLEGRVTTAGVLSGVGPVGDPGTEEGMMAMNRLITRLVRRSPRLVAPIFGLMTAVSRRWPERVIDTMGKRLPAPDAAVINRKEVREAFINDGRHSSRTAAKAAAQDFALFARDWGFRLEDIRVPVHFWQGDADVNVPAAHAARQAERIPGAVLHEWPGEGHMAALDHLEDILRVVTEGAALPA